MERGSETAPKWAMKGLVTAKPATCWAAGLLAEIVPRNSLLVGQRFLFDHFLFFRRKS